MANFMQAYRLTLGHEGGYVNDPADRGGETYKGIARKFWPQWEGWDIIDLSKKKFSGDALEKVLEANSLLQYCVRHFYENEFWKDYRLDQLDQEIANELFDTGVNQGGYNAVKYLQQALNHLNDNQKLFKDIEEDGGLGPKTLEAYRKYMATESYKNRSRERNIATLLKAINGLQFMTYVKIVINDPSQERFFYGWLNRV